MLSSCHRLACSHHAEMPDRRGQNCHESAATGSYQVTSPERRLGSRVDTSNAGQPHGVGSTVGQALSTAAGPGSPPPIRVALPAWQFNRWRQDNEFRYARQHFALTRRSRHLHHRARRPDPHRAQPRQGCIRATDQSTRADHHQRGGALGRHRRTRCLKASCDGLDAELDKVRALLAAARSEHEGIPRRVPLGEIAPDAHLLDSETKLITHTSLPHRGLQHRVGPGTPRPPRGPCSRRGPQPDPRSTHRRRRPAPVGRTGERHAQRAVRTPTHPCVRWPRSASSSTTPKPSTPVPTWSCTTPSNPTPAPHEQPHGDQSPGLATPLSVTLG